MTIVRCAAILGFLRSWHESGVVNGLGMDEAFPIAVRKGSG